MAAPGTPANFSAFQGNGNVALKCDLLATATSYVFSRSSDGITYAQVGNPSTPYYTDTSATVNTLYWYKVAGKNSDGTGTYTSAQQVIPTATSALSLMEIRNRAKQHADMVGSRFVTDEEWNSNIVASYFELYDLLVTTFEEYYVASPYSITTDGSTQYTLPADFYKLLGVDLGLGTGSAGWVTLKKFNFISRNQYVYPSMPATLAGPFSLQYRIVGNTIFMVPPPSSGSTIRLWYVPKLTQPIADTDILSGVSGWTEYVIVDAAIKGMVKEESDPSALMAQKMALLKRIEDSANNRDEGQAETISDVRSNSDSWGGPFGNNPSGGW